MLLTEWKSRLLPPELCREIDAFRSVDKTKGRIDWTIPGFAKNSKADRSLIKKLLHGLKSIWKWVVRLMGLGKDSVEKKPHVKRSQLLYMQSMPWSLYAYYNDSHGLALFVRCRGPSGKKWNRCAAARLSLYSADGRIVRERNFRHPEHRIFTGEPGYSLWGHHRFATVELLEKEGCYLASGAIRVSAEFTVKAETFPTQEVLLLSIANFAAFVSANGTKVYRTSPVLLRDRPLVIEVSIHDNRWLSLCFIYNDGELIEEKGVGIDVTTYCVVKRSKFSRPSYAQAQRDFTFRRENVRQGIQQFARCTTILDPEHGYVKEDGSIVIKAIILAKEASAEESDGGEDVSDTESSEETDEQEND